jgi:hypothetical protein
MNLYRVGNTVLNMDRVTSIQEVPHPGPGPSDPTAPAGANVTRIFFDTMTMDLSGVEAQAFRQWYRHAARNLVVHRDEAGEELLAPEEQLKRLAEHLVALVDRVRPRNAALRHAAHRLHSALASYITGELGPVRARNFEKTIADTESEHAPEGYSEAH